MGIAHIDQQHQKLVGILNRLHHALETGTETKQLLPILDELLAYTAEHFAEEERLMAQTNYPDFEQHQNIHRSLVAKAVAIREEVAAGTATIGIDLLRFLKTGSSNTSKAPTKNTAVT